MEIIGIPVEIMGIGVTVLGTFITVLAIILAWMSDRRLQRNIAGEMSTKLGEASLKLGMMLENIAIGQKEITQMIATGQKEIVAGQKEIAQMLLNQTKILERMETRMAGAKA